MRRLERGLPENARALLANVARAAAASGERVFLVGGVVRDLLLGRAIGDIDVVVEGDAARLARAIAGPGRRPHRLHDAFGTAALRLEDGAWLDIAGARTEIYDAPAALPRVNPGTIGDDLHRRDFTVNAIAVRLRPGGLGEVLDPCGGRRDLRARTIRILYERSFVDDPTRVLRALRFAAQLGFRLHPATARRMREAIHDGGIARLSPSRLRKELERIFGAQRVAAMVPPLARHGVLAAIHPALRAGPEVLPLLRRYEASARRFAVDRDWAIAFGLLAWDRSRRVREELSERLGADRRVRRVLVEGPGAARRVCARLALPSARRASFVHRVCSAESAEVLWLAASSAPRGPVPARIERFLVELRGVRADLRGTDLLHAGIPAGPRVARGLAAALRAKLDGNAPDAPAQLRIALAAARSA